MNHCRVCKIALKDGAAPPCDLYARVYVCRHGKMLGEARCPHGRGGPAVELDADLMLADMELRDGKDIISNWKPADSVTLLHKCLQCEARWGMERVKRRIWKRQAKYREARA